MHIHFVGICGTFMAGLARIAHALGHEVSGSDAAFYPPMSHQLAEMGVTTYHGYDKDIWAAVQPDLVVVGNVCKRGMPLIESMLMHGLPYTSGAAWLGEQVLKQRHVFALAGTHGKTTTTAMLIHILYQQGIAAGYLVGGVMQGFDHSAALGESDYFVIEADEYDTAYFDKRPKFVHYAPDTLVIGNVEFDHADIYDDLQQIQRQFHYAVRLVPPQGTVIFGTGDTVDAVRAKGVWSAQIQVGETVLRQGNQLLHPDGSLLATLPDNLIGEHNYSNALHAALAAQSAGVSMTDSMAALASFKGVKRRLEALACINGITIYDDFAHHPTAIAMTLAALKKQAPNKRVISVFEPRSNTMQMGVHRDSLPAAFVDSDKTFIYRDASISWDILGGADKATHPAINSDVWATAPLIYDNIAQLLADLIDTLRPDDTVVIMSNGHFFGLHEQLISTLRDTYDSA
ncbi:UDP-N-acetylmuramate:L-alanyl-gamma-D-glutamyl-meso-diaminopimelate ligase [Cardiobacteriales bacterium ML27]|uniref:UDP-N-acetylmuramate:L-alanyl-gamma-D-glutamyl-meso-diaminopimelate ligase n=2 Tax=Ostreibacterium oceani TaxID=2654998 RepID=A0A6N7F1X4_9GAMM|nr:UDP-N-acetylmuramate:L-alanyl-gamma-D-glutamyl-meso-diaminopimelate ligase [Ostreibacterium oceani]